MKVFSRRTDALKRESGWLAMNRRKETEARSKRGMESEMGLALHVEAWVRDIETKVKQIVEQNRESPSLMRRNAELVANLSDRFRDELEDLKRQDGRDIRTPLLEIPAPPDSAVVVADSYFPEGWRNRIDNADRAIDLAGNDESKRKAAVEHLVSVAKYDWILPLEILNNALLVAADELEARMHRKTVEALEKASVLASQVGTSGPEDAAGALRVIEQLEKETPVLDPESVEWIASRKKNQEELGLPIETLRNYRLETFGGRKMPDEMFGIDRYGRRWRRRGTRNSHVYYYAPDIARLRKNVN